MPRAVSLRITLALLMLCCGVCNTAWSATAQPVEDFMKLKPKWNSLIGSKFFLEGRFQGSAENVFGLVGCSIEFRLKERVPKFEPRKDVLEINGELAIDERSMTLFMKVESFRKIESDDRILARRRSDLPIDDPSGWYTLGAWAIARGEYYKDNDLIAGGRDCYARAIQIERRDRKRLTPELLEGLSRKASELLSDDSLRFQMLHDAWQMRWEQSQANAKADELLGFSQSLAKIFPFGDVRLTATDAELRDKYWKSPVAVYDANEADRAIESTVKESRRKLFHRVFFVEVVRLALSKKTRPDGSNGKEIAILAESLVPDVIGLAADLRRKEFDYRVSQADQMTYGELAALRKELTQADRLEDARRVFDRWFAFQELTLKKRGHSGLIALSELYESLEELQPRRFRAVEYLLEADRLNPGLPGVSDRLTKHGYERFDGVWMTKEQATRASNTPVAIAMREGRVIPGMSAEQVRKAVGQPTSITRFLTSKVVKEYWGYADSKFSVKLERPTQRTELVVTSVGELGN